jgi:hypothetical protein
MAPPRQNGYDYTIEQNSVSADGQVWTGVLLGYKDAVPIVRVTIAIARQTPPDGPAEPGNLSPATNLDITRSAQNVTMTATVNDSGVPVAQPTIEVHADKKQGLFELEPSVTYLDEANRLRWYMESITTEWL